MCDNKSKKVELISNFAAATPTAKIVTEENLIVIERKEFTRALFNEELLSRIVNSFLNDKRVPREVIDEITHLVGERFIDSKEKPFYYKGL